MKTIFKKYYSKIARTQLKSVRPFIDKIDWTNRVIGIKGNRGVGKTTIILQYLKLNYKTKGESLYVSLDDLYFSEHRLYELADIFSKKGGKILALDEIHRYPNWSQELKNIYDDMPDLKVIFTGSSLLHLQKAKADISRRAVMYNMPGLSFCEFLEFETTIKFPRYSLDEIIKNHIDISMEIISKIKPLSYFDNYLQYGYFPFYLENRNSYQTKISEIILTILEVDIPQFATIQISKIILLKRLLSIISGSVPFTPNMKKLSQRTEISLNTMKIYLKLLAEADLIQLLYSPNKSMNNLNKPNKIFLNNSNLMYNLQGDNANIGNIRETFFYNQMTYNHIVNSSKESDFLIDEKFTFEIGGKNKGKEQINAIENSFIAKDDIEIGSENVIPLWLFGFLY
ncbi:MAG: AAA family ATPase [Bacteroidetes bacterium]|nr:MAG: AAA family ATPase [Bacteroidota bacterium]